MPSTLAYLALVYASGSNGYFHTDSFPGCVRIYVYVNMCEGSKLITR